METLSIVIADDVEEILGVMSTWLRKAGHTVRCATTGYDAAKLVRSAPADLVIADVLMPDGDGLDLITEVRRTCPGARVLAISGGGRYMSAETCLTIAKGLGADAALFKPFNESQLIEGLQAAIGQN